jgi:hypothetical protein
VKLVRLIGVSGPHEVTETVGELKMLEEVGALEHEELAKLVKLEESETW